MTLLVSQQLVIQLYAPTDGPDAATAYADLRAIWSGCGERLGLHDPIPGVNLPDDLPIDAMDLPDVSTEVIQELAVAGRGLADTPAQAIVRRHYDVLNLSTLVDESWPTAEAAWSSVVQGHADALLGAVSIFTARLGRGSVAEVGLAALGEAVRAALPELPAAPLWWQHGVLLAPGLVLWEVSQRQDARASRHFAVVADPDGADTLSRWVWSDGGTTIPPLARYLLHAAKLRYQLRVFLRDHARGPERLDGAHLQAMRRTVEIATFNMATALASAADGPPTSPADDEALAEWFALHLADVEFYAATPPPATRSARDVFVVYGRDNALKERMFSLLTELGLHPMPWPYLVNLTGKAMAPLAEVADAGIRHAQAVVALWAPEDIAWVHENLRRPRDLAHEGEPTMQPRPNVLLETGMAMALHPGRTVIVRVGALRPVTDVDGMDYLRLDDQGRFVDELAARLRTAGCSVDTSGDAWRDPTRFLGLDAHTRQPPSGADRQDGR